MLATLFGSLGGLSLGLTGGGGAILTIPLLVYGLHMSAHDAILFSLFVVSFTALVGLLPKWRWQYCELKIALIVAFGGMLVAPLGAQLSLHVSEAHLLVSFSLLMLAIGILLWWRMPVERRLENNLNTPADYSQRALSSWHVLLFCGGLTGFLTGFFGVGGGFFIVPALVMLTLLPVRQAMTTSLLVIFLISVAGILGHMKMLTVDWRLLFSFLFGSVIGVYFGSLIASRMSNLILQRLFAVMVIITGMVLLLVNL